MGTEDRECRAGTEEGDCSCCCCSGQCLRAIEAAAALCALAAGFFEGDMESLLEY